MRSLKSWALVLASVLMTTVAHSYDRSVSGVVVGFVRAQGNAGVVAFNQAGGAAFPGCASDPAIMWADSAYLTADGQKALLAVLLTAKATGSPVTVWYSTTSGYCRFQIVDLE